MAHETHRAAREVFAYLSETDALPSSPVDAVLGFGTFDVTLAAFCGELYQRGAARRIVFTGGIGAGTADLGRPEADAWRDELFRAYPKINAGHVIVENRSTQTTENIVFTAALLERDFPELRFGAGIRTALLVASPSRLRRVKLSLQHHQPDVRITRCLPPASFERERTLHESKSIDYFAHLTGELDRIVSYPARGWIAAEPLPAAIAAAHAVLLAR